MWHVGMGHVCDASIWAGIVEVRQGPSAEMRSGTWLDSLQVRSVSALQARCDRRCRRVNCGEGAGAGRYWRGAGRSF